LSGDVLNGPAGRALTEANAQESLLLQELRTAWRIAVDAPLTVIGKLSRQVLADGRSIFFLDDLAHPDSGASLRYPLPKVRSHSAFVPPPEIRRLTNLNEALDESLWAVAELQLSPVRERDRHNNPHKCDVRLGSLRLLSDIPEQWNILVAGSEAGHRITAAARALIEKRVKEQEDRLSGELARIEEAKSSLELELEGVRGSIQSERIRLEELDNKILWKKKDMAERFRHLADLLAEQSRRLVALNLIDRDDVAALLPEADARDARTGHDFDAALGGNFARLVPFIQARLWKHGMLFSKAQLRDFLALVRTHDLVVLAGDSGSGKTSLIRAVAESIGGRCTVIPVKPNWTGPEDLLGYYNPIQRSYQATPFLLALQAASKEPEIPHFICLDEMNLARVEHYFADFLSLLESRNDCPVISLYTSDEERHAVVENGLFLTIESEARARAGLPDTATIEDLLKNEDANRLLHQLGGFQDAESVLLHHGRLRRALAAIVRTPTSLRFPANVRIIGAVNIDETTHYLSPKVLDRVHVMRFRNPVLTDWEALEAEIEELDLDLELPLRLLARDLGPRTDYPPFDRKDADAAFLAGLARQHLDPLGVEFGFRGIRQAVNYIGAAELCGIERQAALNNVVLHKILPKLMLDTSRVGSDGRNKRDILIALRDDLATEMTGLDIGTVTESCVDALDSVIAGAEGNNGIANYWLR
jgi:hypothetical protein